MQGRKDDPESVTLSKTEFIDFARNRSGRSGVKDWIQLAVAVAVPVVAMLFFFSESAFQTEQNKADLKKHDEWIENHNVSTDAIKHTINNVDKTQAVILEKFTFIEETMKHLNEEQLKYIYKQN